MRQISKEFSRGSLRGHSPQGSLLGAAHLSSGCWNRSTCKDCGRRHHTLQHGISPKSSKIQPSESSLQDKQQTSYRREVPSQKEPVPDSASSNSTWCRRHWNLFRFKYHTWKRKADSQQSRWTVVQRLEKHSEVDLPKSYIRETITSRRDQIPRPDIVKKWPHLKRIQIPLYEDNVEIGLLISCNCPRAIKPTEVIRGKSEEPYAVHT